MNSGTVQFGPSGLVLEERAHVVALELFAAGEELQLDDEGEADDRPAQLFDEADDGRGRAAGREQVVGDDDAVARADGVAVHLVNYGYDDERDGVAVIDSVELAVRLAGTWATARAVRPGRAPEPLELTAEADVHRVRLTDVGLYTVVVLR